MTNQEIFDAVLNGIRSQNGFGFDQIKGNCEYLDAQSGNRCAVGLLCNPEELSKIQTNNYDVTELYHIGLAPSCVTANNMNFVFGLQLIHDRAATKKSMSLFEDGMSEFANSNRLVYR